MIKFRIYFLLSIFGIASLLLIYRAVQLQLLPSRHVERLARRQLNKTISIVGRRGDLRDRNGQDLAISTNSLSIYLNPQQIVDFSKVAKSLSRVLGVSGSELEKRIRKLKSKKFVWLQRQLNSEQLFRLRSLELKDFPGVGILPEFRRIYPYNETASHLLGFVSIDGKGLSGVEAAQELRLTGESREVIVPRDARGRPLFNHTEQLRLEDTKGEDLQLSLDINFQGRVESLLANAIDFHKADSAMALVMNPESGELLAWALSPGFDPNQAGHFSINSRRNRVIADPIEPGSVVKPFLVARALEDKLVSPSSLIPAGDGKLKIGNKVITDSESKHYFKEISIRDLIKFSSNVATVNLQKMMGFSRVESVYKDIGFFEKTGVAIHGESKGIYHSPSSKQKLEQATISYGHGIAVTPLQVLVAYSIFANGGYKVKPKIFRSREIEVKNESQRIFSKRTLKQMNEILKRVAEKGGTGEAANVPGFKVAGKTGTALKTKTDGKGYVSGAYVSSFAGYFPADKPEIVAYVVVDNPRENGKYASQVAAPLFAEIAKSYLSIVKRDRSEQIVAKAVLRTSNKTQNPKTIGVQDEQMPTLRGMNLVTALKMLEDKPVRVQIEGEGLWVEDQIIKKQKNGKDIVELWMR